MLWYEAIIIPGSTHRVVDDDKRKGTPLSDGPRHIPVHHPVLHRRFPESLCARPLEGVQPCLLTGPCTQQILIPCALVVLQQ